MDIQRKKRKTGETEEFLFLIEFVPCTIEASIKIIKGVRYFFLKYPECAEIFDREFFYETYAEWKSEDRQAMFSSSLDRNVKPDSY